MKIPYPDKDQDYFERSLGKPEFDESIEEEIDLLEELTLILLRQEEGDEDWEETHFEADNLLVRFLREKGYNKEMDVFDKIGKWYA